ncbi:DEAD/DEAH box helicase family protein [Mycolicibacterium fortuitum]|uniref:DEAD/DEAH box helicase family protein n=1 Tax=Mycolicibacterium fortuitum TaxID=1766 RepID=UPI003AB08B3A
MDFDRLLDDAAQTAPIEPRELYAWLPDKAEGYGYLRDVQGQVLTTWHQRRHERDLIIKVNTGSGKTIDGLVILQSYLHDNEGPALYVAPNKYLAAQVREEARRIGIVTTDDVDSAQYRAGEAIGVVNIWKLFNGRSVFREDRYPSKPVPIGSVVIDDAHAALDTARSSLSITINRDIGTNKTAEGKLFADLLNLFREDLTKLSPNALLDVDEKSFGALARVPFWAWRSRLEQVRKRLHQDRELDALTYSWPAVKDVLPFCRTVFTSTGVTITPLCSPVSLISNFHTAKHRIYLTATLADDSVLVTDFGADPASVSVPITPTTAGDIGERMILAPMELNPEISAAEVRAHILTLAEDYNTVVIVPSNSVAAEWEQLLGDPSRIIRADDVSDIVTRLRSGEHVGLVVLVNKYDGIDLPGDACRILVLDGLPEAFSGEERLETQLTSRESGTDDRQVQRIEQGMGRGVRSNEDHCVVLLLGARLTQLVADPDTFALFSPATQEQLKQSRKIAGGLVDEPLSEIMGVALQALTRDAGWVRFARQGLASITPAVGHVSPAATHRRAAFEAATAGKITDAVEELAKAVASTTDPRQQGWLLEQQATYIDQHDPARAQEVLAAAREKNPAVLRPLSGVEYKKISASAAQATAASDYLTQTYGTDRIKLRVGFEALLDALRFDPSPTAVEAFEQAFCDLGLHLGFNAQRPERDIGRGPDDLWALGDLKYWVIEAKSGAVADYIAKGYINQLTGSKLWFDGAYDDTVTALPVMIHPAERLGKDATALPGARVITTKKLDALKDAVRAYATALAESRWDDPDTVDRFLTGHKLRAGDLYGYTRAIKPA